MSFVDSIVKNKPDKYQTLIESKVLAKQLELKVRQYNVLQTEYNNLIRKQTVERKPSSGGWARINGSLKQISAAGKKWLWGVNSGDGIYTCKKPCTDSNWIKIPGGLTQIEGGDKEVWGVNSSNNIYKMNQDHSNNWKYIPGKLNNISQGGGWVWGVNSSNNVYRCKQPCDGKWILDTAGIKEDTGGSIGNKEECGNAAAKIYGNGKVFKKRDTQSGDWSWVPPGCTVQSGGDWAPHWNTRSGTCKSGSGYTCVENKKNSNQTPSLVQLSCSNTHVYGVDTSKKAWIKNIDGSGEWSRFGNPNTWNIQWINASSNKSVYIVTNKNKNIYETNIDGTQKWQRISSSNMNPNSSTISGDPENNETIYTTSTDNGIYKYSPITGGGNWTDINNENYMADVAGPPKQSNENWKYLGQTDNLTECKIKAVEDKENEYASIVYTTTNGNYNKTCYGGIKGGVINPIYTKGMTTSLAPNGTSRLGGDEGQKMLNQMKKFQDEIQDLTKKAAEDNIGLEKSKKSINSTKMARNKKMEELVERLRTDRIQINKLLREPDDIASAEDSNFQQESNYYVYFLWILLVIISLFMASHIITTDGENISTITYVFVSIWILILFKYYSQVVSSYGVSFWNYISTLLVDPL